MRVIAGTRRSMPLKAPTGTDTRPTQDRTKETLFNVLQNDVPGACFLDLFAGSGAIGIEALSRGASHVTMVENGRNAITCIKENLRFTRFTDEVSLIESDILSALERLKGHAPFDIVFMDPPYEGGFEEPVFGMLSGMDNITQDTIIVLEASLKLDLDFIEATGFSVYKIKTYKTNRHIFIKRKKIIVIDKMK